MRTPSPSGQSAFAVPDPYTVVIVERQVSLEKTSAPGRPGRGRSNSDGTLLLVAEPDDVRDIGPQENRGTHAAGLGMLRLDR